LVPEELVYQLEVMVADLFSLILAQFALLAVMGEV
jgi:hypothetical protein